MADTNRSKLAQAAAKKTGRKISDVAEILDSLLDEILVQFREGNTIELRGFGTFYPYFKKARTYIIPRLKQERQAKGRITLKFRPSKHILVYKGVKK